MSYEKRIYRFINNDTGAILGNDTNGKLIGAAYDPKNAENSERTLKRSTKTFGIYTELSKNLIFTKDVAAFLRSAYSFKDIEANVTMEEWRIHPITEVVYLYSTNLFDFSEYSSDKLTVKIPFKTGGLNALIKAQLREKFELERLESINGEVIDELIKKDVALTSREIFLLSKLKENESILRVNSQSQFTANGKKHRKSFPLEIISNSDIGNINEPIPTPPDAEASVGATAQTSDLFYIDADIDHLGVRLQIDFSFKISEDSFFAGDVDDKNLYVRLKRYNNGNSFDFVENIATPTSITDNIFTHLGETFTYSGIITVDILAGESLSFVFEMEADYGAPGAMVLDFEEIECSIKIEEDSIIEDTQTKAVVFKDIGEKQLQIITGKKNRYYSDFYTNGEFKLTAATLGFWIRQFYDKKIEWSIDGFLKTSNAIHNTGYTIEIINDVETLVHEDMKYFFQEQTVIKIPNQVSDLKRETAKEFYHSSLEFGYKKPSGDRLYEEAMGLDEYNTKNGFVNNITRVDKKYSKVSDARADGYGKEFARRKPQLNFPEEDTRYDKDIHLLDCKDGLGNALEERIWSDDFEEAPKNVYSPDTATNLRLTPWNCSERHQWFFGSGLIKHQEEKVRFSNGGGNTELVTKKTSEVERAENGDIIVSDLKKPRFVNQWITFKHEVDYFLNEQIYGKTEVNGRMIPNYFFKVEFINESGVKEQGYLFEVKPNKEGFWKILKSA